MPGTAHGSPDGIDKQLYEFVVEQVRIGVDRVTLIERLEAAGLSYTQAYEVVDMLYPKIAQEVAREQAPALQNILQAIIGGVLAAGISGAAWAAIAVIMELEVGFAAWGIGFLAGWAVALFSRGKKGLSLQVIAVVSSLAGIALGKYITFYYYLMEAIGQDFGLDIAVEIPMFSKLVFDTLLENLSLLFSTFDILWVSLAVGTAWRFLQEQKVQRRIESPVPAGSGGEGAGS